MPDPTKFQALEFHRIADAFPMLDDTALKELADDIRDHGLHEPIIRYQGKVLDGRNRYLAAQTAGIEPRFVDFNGDDAQAVALVISRNLRRRHLDTSQRAIAAARLANMSEGRPSKTSPIGDVSQAAAAKALNVGKRSVERAAVVLDQGTSELIKAVEAGDIPVSTAADLAREPVETQRAIIKTAQIETTAGVARLSMPERLEVPDLPATTEGFTVANKRVEKALEKKRRAYNVAVSKTKAKASTKKPATKTSAKTSTKSKPTAPSPSPFAAVIGELEGTVDWFALPEWKAALGSKLTEPERQRMMKAVNAISRHIEAAFTALSKSKLH